MKSVLPWLLAFALFASTGPIAIAQETSPAPSPSLVVPAAAANADPATATRAWLDTVPPEKKASSDAYFEGGYWLILFNWLLAVAVALALLNTRISARIRDFAERTTRFKAMQVAIYVIAYLLLTSLLEFPLGVYERYFREHAYGLSNQTFGAWFAEQMKGLGIGLIAFPLITIALYAIFRRAPKTWWVWGTGLMVCFVMFGAFIAPVFIEPLFNKYKPLTDPAISEAILTMARANQIPVTQVFEVDASRQSKRISANVAGFLGTTRIALNDNLLTQCTLPEIRYVMSHEMGHYVLNHIYKFVVSLSLLWLVMFAVARLAFNAAVRRWGQRWQVRGIADPAGLPLLALIAATLGFLATPITNTITRVAEVEADAFGINTSREPDGMAAVALKLGTYRKLDPSPVEEFFFFDHPSGRARIRMAMDWKAAHLPAGGE
ncbi:MAG: M48 family metallopeptidase [Verrucomicrobiota bacterium]|nr:M48 family metallopeptidase [Verrucomicrobiota bacterium]